MRRLKEGVGDRQEQVPRKHPRNKTQDGPCKTNKSQNKVWKKGKEKYVKEQTLEWGGGTTIVCGSEVLDIQIASREGWTETSGRELTKVP